MGRTTLERVIAERQRAVRRSVANELHTVRVDEGLSLRQVAAAAGLHPSHLPRIETGDRQPSLDALVALAAAMGHDVSIRLFPSEGPRVRDHVQVRMIEALLAALHPRWVGRLEVPVYQPVRGVIDVVLRDRTFGDVVAGEGHSALHTVERQLRWAEQKQDALPSARGWPWTDDPAPPRTSRLLLLRSSAANRELVRSVPRTFATAFPADTGEALAALTGADMRWPGAALLWVNVDGAATHLMAGTPRGLRR